MIFSNISFVFYFLVAVLALYYSVPYKYKNLVLFLFSLFFYFYGEKEMTILLVFMIAFNYFISKYIVGHKGLFILAIIIDFSFLIYFKYTNFFIDNFNSIFNTNIVALRIILPIGISFFTFQAVSYLIDVYRKEIEPSPSLIHFGTYLSFFPQLIAGPIVRYKTISKEIINRRVTLEDFKEGIVRFVIGLAKKMILANSFGEVIVLLSSIEATKISSLLILLAITFQLYFDFSAYSDMAIGMAKFFGFHFDENFDYPLTATSITTFWRKWHISLSSWFKDYVYIPLGGSRKGLKRQLINIFIVWTLTGFWHGAEWNFILWGMYYAILLMIEKVGLFDFLKRHSLLGWSYTFILTLFGFALFHYVDFNELKIFIFNLFNAELINTNTLYYLKSFFILFILGFIAMTPLFKKGMMHLKKYAFYDYLEWLYITVLFVIVIAYMVDASFNPFLYFRF